MFPREYALSVTPRVSDVFVAFAAASEALNHAFTPSAPVAIAY